MTTLSEKIRNLFSTKSEKKSVKGAAPLSDAVPVHSSKYIDSEVVSLSDSTFLASAAARICIGLEAIDNYADRLSHIGRVIGRGHESTIEHTNVIVVIHFSDDLMEDFLKVAQSMHYLNWHITKGDDDINHVLIGGSLRAYKNMYRESKESVTNAIYEEIKKCLYLSAEKVFFKDLIDDGIMAEDEFSFIPVARTNLVATDDGNADLDGTVAITEVKKGKRVDLIKAHNTFTSVYEAVYHYGFSRREVSEVCAVSVIFHDFSRIISQQVTRHRNAITQESQRYVNYKDKPFIDPIKFVEDGDVSKKYNFIFMHNQFESTSQDLGDSLTEIYEQLINQGMLKQDARSFLPGNVATKLMMTFTYKSLLHFLCMREDKAAQAEVRTLAFELEAFMRANDPEFFEGKTVEELWAELSEEPVYKSIRKAEEEKLEGLDEVIAEE